MSQTMQFPCTDPILNKYGVQSGLWDKVVDLEWCNTTVFTAIVRLDNVWVSKPRPAQMVNGQMTKPSFSATLLFHPHATSDVYQAILAVAEARFQPETRPNIQNPSEMVVYTASQMLYFPKEMNGLHNPLREGTQIWMTSKKPELKEYYKGIFAVNAALPPVDQKGNPQSVVCLDEMGNATGPDRFYSGCYARAQIRIYAYPGKGKQGQGQRGISAVLMSLRKVCDGARIGGFDKVASATSGFNAMPHIQIDAADLPDSGFGFNAAPAIPPGFAAPMPQQPQPQYQQQPQPQYQQPQQPNSMPGGYVQQQPQPSYAPAGFTPPAGAPAYTPPQQYQPQQQTAPQAGYPAPGSYPGAPAQGQPGGAYAPQQPNMQPPPGARPPGV